MATIRNTFEVISLTYPNLTRSKVLEIFGGDGSMSVKYYNGMVGHIHAWELDPEKAKRFESNIPNGQCIKGDARKLIKEVPERSYDIVVCDNPAGHPEHFDIISDIFRVTKIGGWVILNVIPDAAAYWRGQRGNTSVDYLKEWERHRTKFYGVDDRPITLCTIIGAYHKLAEEAGLCIRQQTMIKITEVWHLGLNISGG